MYFFFSLRVNFLDGDKENSPAYSFFPVLVHDILYTVARLCIDFSFGVFLLNSKSFKWNLSVSVCLSFSLSFSLSVFLSLSLSFSLSLSLPSLFLSPLPLFPSQIVCMSSMLYFGYFFNLISRYRNCYRTISRHK